MRRPLHTGPASPGRTAARRRTISRTCVRHRGITFGAGTAFRDDVGSFWTTRNGSSPDGTFAGGCAEASLDLRAYGFLVGIGSTYYALVPLDVAAPVQHALEAHLTLGFGFVL